MSDAPCRTLAFVREVARGELAKAKGAGCLLDGYEIARDALDRIVDILAVVADHPGKEESSARVDATIALKPRTPSGQRGYIAGFRAAANLAKQQAPQALGLEPLLISLPQYPEEEDPDTVALRELRKDYEFLHRAIDAAFPDLSGGALDRIGTASTLLENYRAAASEPSPPRQTIREAVAEMRRRHPFVDLADALIEVLDERGGQ